ncbi:MAG: hypothetical protein ACE5Q8_07805 [Nitrosopumilus sp.]
MKLVIFGLIALMISSGMVTQSFAHNTVIVEDYEIEIGWGIEPPLQEIRNNIVMKFVKIDDKGGFIPVVNIFKNLEAKVVYGGLSKSMEVESEGKPGYYFSKIIPTKTGSYLIELKGEIEGTTIDISVPVEDVETTAAIDFPPKLSQGDSDISSLKNAISSLQQDMSKVKTGETNVTTNNGTSYDFAIFAISISGAAIIIAIISLVKRK